MCSIIARKLTPVMVFRRIIPELADDVVSHLGKKVAYSAGQSSFYITVSTSGKQQKSIDSQSN